MHSREVPVSEDRALLAHHGPPPQPESGRSKPHEKHHRPDRSELLAAVDPCPREVLVDEGAHGHIGDIGAREGSERAAAAVEGAFAARRRD